MTSTVTAYGHSHLPAGLFDVMRIAYFLRFLSHGGVGFALLAVAGLSVFLLLRRLLFGNRHRLRRKR